MIEALRRLLQPKQPASDWPAHADLMARTKRRQQELFDRMVKDGTHLFSGRNYVSAAKTNITTTRTQ